MTEQNLPAKQEPFTEQITNAILSFSDPNLVAMAFAQLGWTFGDEIRETLQVVRQSGNLGAKMTALKHLRSLIKEAAETAGLVGKVSKTFQGPGGEQTTFSANRIALALNPVKQVESKSYVPRQELKLGESSNEQQEQETESNRSGFGSEDAGGANAGRTKSGRDSGPSLERCGDGREASQPTGGADNETHDTSEIFGGGVNNDEGGLIDACDTDGEQPGNSCVQLRPPTCDPKLFPGISGTSAES